MTTQYQDKIQKDWTTATSGLTLSQTMQSQLATIQRNKDYALLAALTDIVRVVRGQPAANPNGIGNLNPHNVNSWTVRDFNYLNHIRLKLGGRGVWRVCFSTDLKTLHGIYDEHNKNLKQWTNTGLQANTAAG